ncbi:MAG: HAD-IC family P-type ATPase [Halioglobus sp.]
MQDTRTFHTGRDDVGLRAHAQPVDVVMAALAVTPQGLTADDAATRLQHYGPNRLPAKPSPGVLSRLLAQINNLLTFILLAAVGITAALGHWLDSGVILMVVIVQAVVGFVQEGKAEQALAAIRHMLAPQAAVWRDGCRQTIAGEDLVPGDIVLLEAGDRVPADLRLLESRTLQVDEAILTGESLPVEKTTEPLGVDLALGDHRNMAYSGTLVSYGTGRGVVVATGARTEIGRISGMLAGIEQLTTPLLRQMHAFARYLSFVIVGLGVLIFALGYWLGHYPPSELFMIVVGLTVAAIPEGLPAILAVTLAIGVQGMARRQAVVRHMPAIETLGSVTVICSDKTGTLTRNEMMVAAIVAGGLRHRVSGEGYAPDGMIEDHGQAPADVPGAVREVALAALLCNDARVVERDGRWLVEGDSMEGALVVLATKAGFDSHEERRTRPRLDAIPFDAQHRFMATLHHDHEGCHWIFVKGAPERLLSMCATEYCLGGGQALDKSAWEARIAELAADGMRVLGLARKSLAEPQQELAFVDVESGLELIGIIGLLDPPREEAVTAVAECHRAGIGVKMITGDHALTAQAVARQLGLRNAGKVISGHEIDALDDAGLARAVAEVDVFARTSPEHKLRLVQALQTAGEVVAMTGDGVNDAPALKRAEVGVAMGRKGSEVAKEAAKIVLLDDNFATIVSAVKAGRTVYANLKKSIAFFLPINGGESASLVVALLAGLTLPITAVQILWVNMVSSVALAMSLAFSREPDVMQRPPHPPGERLLDAFLVWRIALVSLLFLSGIFGMYEWAVSHGRDINAARTLAVNTLVVMEVFYLFAVRYLDNHP